MLLRVLKMHHYQQHKKKKANLRALDEAQRQINKKINLDVESSRTQKELDYK